MVEKKDTCYDYVYATMITDDKYLPGIQVMHYTLRKFTDRTLVIIA